MYDKGSSEINLSLIPLSALRSKSKDKLACMLNRHKVIKSPAPDCLPRDYRGLADLMDINILSAWLGESPMNKILYICEKEKHFTIRELQIFLEKIDRYDVLDDTFESFLEDAIAYENRSKSLVECSQMYQSLDMDGNILTLDDILRIRNGGGPQIYDAFILYVESDRPFAEKVIKTLEDDYGLKICDKDRDLAAGVSFEHNAVMKLISERCNKLLVILSDEFVRSDRHTFFLKYAEALTYDLGKRKVIPCTYKPCNLPFEYRAYFRLDFERFSNFGNFWEKLHTCVAPVLQQNALPWESAKIEKLTITEIDKNNDELPINNSLKELKNKAYRVPQNSTAAKYIADDSTTCNGNTQLVEPTEDMVKSNEIIEMNQSYPLKQKLPKLLSGLKFRLKKKKKKPISVCAS